MVPVGLYDHLECAKAPAGEIHLTCRGFSVPNDQNNLVFKAAEAFFTRTGLKGGIALKLTKNIPVAAGLGGGSSDAAFTLRALNDMWSHPLSSEDLADLAVRLGADVPFFLICRPSLATGIGEVLKPIKNWPEYWYVIVTPPFEISTAWVYRNLKLKLTPREYDYIFERLEQHPLEVCQLLENDLETVTGLHFPTIERMKTALLEAGAEGALMSGSGPSVFGVFKSQEHAFRAKDELKSQNLGRVFVAKGIG